MILNISEAANLGIHALGYLARDGGETPVTTATIAGAFGVSEAHLSKVFQRLAKAGLVRSVRGPRGGFRLARPPAKITLREVYEALDGPLEGARCLLRRPTCGLHRCVLGPLVEEVTERVHDQLTRTTLADVAEI